MPVQTRQATRKAIATRTACDIAGAKAKEAVPGSLGEYTAIHGATVRHELGPEALGATVVSTLIDRYLAQLPPDTRELQHRPPPTEFAIGDTVKITQGLDVYHLTPQRCVGSILEIDTMEKTAVVLLAGTNTRPCDVPLEWLEPSTDPRVTLTGQIAILLARLQHQ